MEVQVLSNETIKPSSPTPDHLRHYKLSFLDQISPRIYSPIIYYYAMNDLGDETNYVAGISEKLKKSLSQALTLYYPLAGRFSDVGDSLQCDDEGVPYKEARVIKTKLDDVLKDPVPLELNKLLPFELDEVAELPLGVQLNVFACGGLAVGVCVSHRLGDALSVLVFIRTWMAIARREDIDALPRPEFNSADLFRPQDTKGYDPSLAAVKKNMCATNVTKRFALATDKIEALRAKCEERTSQSGENPRRVSRIEAVSAFIWTRFAAAAKLAESEPPEKTYAIIHPVNIRPKLDPPLPQYSFGNYYTPSAKLGPVSSTSEEQYCYGLAREIGEALRRVDKGFVEYIRDRGDEFFEFVKKETDRFLKGEVVGLSFSSLCRFPLYEADFGFGKPAWVSSAARGFECSVGFMDNKAGDGIEAYICLSLQDMDRLEADKEFLAFVSPNIGPK